MTRTPRQTFSTSAHRQEMEKISGSEAFLSACDYSLLALTEEINNPLDPAGLAQIIGARRVLEILKTVHEPVSPTKTIRPATLNYEQK